METPGNDRVLLDDESFTIPTKSQAEGNYAVVVTRLPQHSSIDLVFDNESEAKNLERRLHYPDNEKDIYEGAPQRYQLWKDLNLQLSAPAKLLDLTKEGSKFRLRIIANYEPTKDFKNGTVNILFQLGLVPQKVLELLS